MSSLPIELLDSILLYSRETRERVYCIQADSGNLFADNPVESDTCAICFTV